MLTILRWQHISFCLVRKICFKNVSLRRSVSSQIFLRLFLMILPLDSDFQPPMLFRCRHAAVVESYRHARGCCLSSTWRVSVFSLDTVWGYRNRVESADSSALRRTNRSRTRLIAGAMCGVEPLRLQETILILTSADYTISAPFSSKMTSLLSYFQRWSWCENDIRYLTYRFYSILSKYASHVIII